MKVYVKERKRRQGQFQFYMCQFVEAAQRSGFKVKKSFLFNCLVYSHDILLVIIRSCWGLLKRGKENEAKPAIIEDVFHQGDALKRMAISCYSLFRKRKKRKAVMVTSRGEALFRNAFPFCYRYEIIPMLWDVWPIFWEQLHNDLKILDCKIVFVTVRSVAEMISKDWGIRAYWVPEGIDVNDFKKGDELAHRTIDVYELGRQKKDYHLLLEKMHEAGVVKTYYRNIFDANGRLLQLAFPSTDDLCANLPHVKIMVSFPRADTHPENAGNLDTLTQRYWEGMLSRCLIVGRAPQELIDLLGYDPVVEVDWTKPEEQLQTILEHISSYQPLVDRNYRNALEYAAWDKRFPIIIGKLRENGYIV